ncbi:MAG: hypothetical protein ACJAQ8_002576 [Haliea salexigens]|jgi:hypothetical protein
MGCRVTPIFLTAAPLMAAPLMAAPHTFTQRALLLPAAGTGEQVAPGVELGERAIVGRVALALPKHRFIPVQPVLLQAVQNGVSGAGLLSRWIDVFHAQ